MHVSQKGVATGWNASEFKVIVVDGLHRPAERQNTTVASCNRLLLVFNSRSRTDAQNVLNAASPNCACPTARAFICFGSWAIACESRTSRRMRTFRHGSCCPFTLSGPPLAAGNHPSKAKLCCELTAARYSCGQLRRTSLRTFRHLLVLAALICSPSEAQVTIRGSLGGEVLDPSGQRVSGAGITAIREGTNLRSTTITDAEGRFHLSALPPGSYSVLVEKTGFQRLERAGITVEVNQSARIRLTRSPSRPQLSTAGTGVHFTRTT